MKILVAIESCLDHLPRHVAQEETWLKDLPANVDYRFFIGASASSISSVLPNTVGLPVDDSYQALSLKTRAICRYVLDYNYDFVFKADTDTLVNPKNLLDSGFERHYYSGGFNEDNMPKGLLSMFPEPNIQFASGGAGYWLNRRSAMLVAYGPAIATQAEDVYVACILKDNGITPIWSPDYRWKPGESVDKDTISLHLSSALQKKYEPAQMYEYYQKIA